MSSSTYKDAEKLLEKVFVQLKKKIEEYVNIPTENKGEEKMLLGEINLLKNIKRKLKELLKDAGEIKDLEIKVEELDKISGVNH